MEFTFKGYTVAELCSFHGHQFMGVIKGNTFVGEVFVGFGRVYLLSNCDELNGRNFIVEKEENPNWKYNWVIFDDFHKDLDSYNKEELFELFAITKEKKQEEEEIKVPWEVKAKESGDKNIEYFRNNRTDVV